jgi:hypothetical protein
LDSTKKLQSESQQRIGGMKHLFITGVFRTGTSLLSTALNVHPNVLVGWQPFWLFFKECRNKFFKDVIGAPFDPEYPMGVFQFRSEDESKLFQDVLNQVQFNNSELASLISKIKAYLLDKSEKINTNMKPASLSKHIEDMESGSAGYVLKQLLERLYLAETRKKERAQIRVVGIKEVFCEEYIEPILNYEGLDFSVLHIIRDPRAIVASRNYGKYMEATESKYPIFFMIRSWRRTVENYFLNRNRTNYLMIKYEDLVTYPEDTLRQICNILQVRFSQDLLDFSKYTDTKGNKWKTNSSFEDAKTFSTFSVSRWKGVLSSEEIEVIEYFCQSELKYMGYEVTTRDFDVKRIFNFYEDITYVNYWLRKYDFNLQVNEIGIGAA